MPKLEHVDISEEARRWSFSVRRDEEVGVLVVEADD
jgi:hypothetical protein